MEIRTPVLTLKGLRPGPLDDGGELVFAPMTHVIGVICGGMKPPISRRADCIIPSHTGQAIESGDYPQVGE